MSLNFYKWLGLALIFIGGFLVGSAIISSIVRADTVVEKMIAANGKCLAAGYEYPVEGRFQCEKYVMTVVTNQDGEKRVVISFLAKGNTFGFAGPVATKTNEDGNAFMQIDHVYLPRGTANPEWGVNLFSATDPKSEKNRCVFYPDYKMICTLYYNNGESLAAVVFAGTKPVDVSNASKQKLNDLIRNRYAR